MDEPAQERAGGQHHRPCPEFAAVGQAYAGHAARNEKIVHLAGDDREVGHRFDRRLHGRGIELAVGLGARAAHRRPLAAVEHAELDAAGVRHPAHEAVEGVDLAHEMALPEPADRRIARHGADGRGPLRDHGGARAHPRGGRSGFAAGMAAADNDHVVSRFDRHLLCSKSVVVLAKPPSPVKIAAMGGCFT